MRLFARYFLLLRDGERFTTSRASPRTSLAGGISHPAFSAALSARTECIGGSLTSGGIGMRFVSIPMIINLAVAVLSAKLKELLATL
jgi:uncharacterized membrane protein YphA (DoxX/SURF4 family)